MSSLRLKSVVDESVESRQSAAEEIPSHIKAIAIVLLVFLVTFYVAWIVVHTEHTYIPLGTLGVFYGIVLSYPATMLLGPQLQSALGGLIGGISLGTLSHKMAYGTTSIRYLSRFISTNVKDAVEATVGPYPHAEFLENGIVLCIWMALITMLLVIAINAYLKRGSADAKAAPKITSTIAVTAGQPHALSQAASN
jgi:hypothetical protein